MDGYPQELPLLHRIQRSKIRKYQYIYKPKNTKYLHFIFRKQNLKDTIDQNPDKFLGSFVLSKFNNNKDLPFLFKVKNV